MVSLPLSRKKRNTALAMFLQYYLWSFSLLVFHRDLQRLFSHEELKKWHGLTKNAHFFTSLLAMRILNEFFRRTDYREDMRAHHFGFRSRGRFISQREIDRVSRVLMHASYAGLRLRRPHWNIVDWCRRLTKRAVPFLEFVRDTHFRRSAETRAEIDSYLSMTAKLMAYAEKAALDEETA